MNKKKIILTVTLSLLVLIAVAVNWKYSLLGNLFNQEPQPDSVSVSAGAELPEESYFDKARYTRAQSREEAISLLNSVINDDSVEEQIRENAYKEVIAYAKITEGEAALESVLLAKGFEDCVVYLTSDTATVVVSSENLTEQQTAQIFDAVLSQTGFEGGAVKIVAYP